MHSVVPMVLDTSVDVKAAIMVTPTELVDQFHAAASVVIIHSVTTIVTVSVTHVTEGIHTKVVKEYLAVDDVGQTLIVVLIIHVFVKNASKEIRTQSKDARPFLVVESVKVMPIVIPEIITANVKDVTMEILTLDVKCKHVVTSARRIPFVIQQQINVNVWSVSEEILTEDAMSFPAATNAE